MTKTPLKKQKKKERKIKMIISFAKNSKLIYYRFLFFVSFSLTIFSNLKMNFD